MFSRATDASKIALVHLMARLKAGGFTLLDTQFTNPHLEQFGVLEIPREDFKTLLSTALAAEASFPLIEDDFALVQSLCRPEPKHHKQDAPTHSARGFEANIQPLKIGSSATIS